MGLLDQLVGDMLGQTQAASGAPGNSPGLAGVLTNLLGGVNSPGQSGGFSGLIQQFRAAGLGHIVDSWVGNGPNAPVTPEQLRNVLGPQQTARMAAESGTTEQGLLSQLAQHLPGLVDRMTPEGRLPPDSTLSAVGDVAQARGAGRV